jgi:hydroxymethylglutaryl-CoA reductase
LPIAERLALIQEWADLTDEETAVLAENGLSSDQANHMVENALGTFGLPLGIAANFLINDRDYLIPMAVEEPSVVAAVSHAAKLIRSGGGFQTEASEPVMIGQIQVLDIPDMQAAQLALAANKQQLMDEANSCSQNIVRRAAGPGILK